MMMMMIIDKKAKQNIIYLEDNKSRWGCFDKLNADEDIIRTNTKRYICVISIKKYN